MRIDTRSALVGAGILGGVLALSGYQLPAVSSPVAELSVPSVTIKGPVDVNGIPSWEDLVSILEGTTYTVPDGKVLVITGVTAANPPSSFPSYAMRFHVRVDGQDVLDGRLSTSSSYGSVASVDYGYGYPVQAPSVVEVVDNEPSVSAMVLGYLADA